ncbi:MAG TPA: putative Ig domain-containing protein [Steroidobacteraceae bacterium]|nr:putative Ig domain-containing protein [Steroidobacteraceae bacterium]
MSPSVHAENRAPGISGSATTTAAVGTRYAMTLYGWDHDGDALKFSVRNLPSWLSFSYSDSAAKLIGTPTAAGTFSNVSVSVTDGQATTSFPAFSITVSSSGTSTSNRAPTISGTPPANAVVGSSYSFQPSASDADGDTLRFSATNLPGWLSLNSGTGRLAGTPSSQHVGTYDNIRVSVSDGKTSAALGPFAITVASGTSGSNRAPGISGTAQTPALVGQRYAMTVYGWDHDKDPLRFSVRNLPSWLSFSYGDNWAKLNGVPTTSGTFSNISISVTDGKSTTNFPAFSITVSGSGTSTGNRAPTISGSPPTSVSVGTSYAFQPTARDADGDTLRFSATNLPAWLALSSSTGRISGTATSQHIVTYDNIRITVSDGKSSASLGPFSIAVLASGSATGSVTLSWQPPTRNTDGTTLTDLAGFRIRYGTSSSSLTRTLSISNPGITSAVVEDLASGTWYFAVTAVNSKGVESDLSSVVSKRL